MRLRFNSTLKTAFIDLSVVFIGIIIALQVDQWREARSYHRSETQYLQRLDEELKVFISDSESILSFIGENLEGVSFVYQSLNQGEIINGNTDLFEHGLIYVGHLPTFTVNRSAYDEMVFSGMFARLESEDLRRTLSSLFAEQETMKGHFSWWRNIPLDLEKHISPLVEFYTEDRSPPSASAAGGLIYEPKRRINYDFDALLADPIVKNGFYWAEDTHEDWLRLLTELVDLATAAEALLAEELMNR
ncbi:MAG: DUF6090 family protein [Puniceicoccaceae bacterium]